MTQWSYLALDVNQYGKVIVTGAREVDLSWIKTRFPKARWNDPLKGGFFDAEIESKGHNTIELGTAILEYLGSQGWEAYATSGTLWSYTVRLKRPMDDKG
jgi:hypothetical protein